MDKLTATECPSADYCRGYNDAVDDAESYNWIKMEDRLPADEGEYLLYSSSLDLVSFATFDRLGDWRRTNWTMHSADYWAPLPKGPRK